VTLVVAQSDERESTLRPFPGARPPRRGQWTAEVRQPPIAFVIADSVSNGRMRESQFSSCKISLRHAVWKSGTGSFTSESPERSSFGQIDKIDPPR
jgi:hypothetical protein